MGASYKWVRRQLYARDRGKCAYCGDKVPFKVFTLDHIIPIARGGGNDWSNLVVSCVSCNSAKGDKLNGIVWPKLAPWEIDQEREKA